MIPTKWYVQSAQPCHGETPVIKVPTFSSISYTGTSSHMTRLWTTALMKRQHCKQPWRSLSLRTEGTCSVADWNCCRASPAFLTGLLLMAGEAQRSPFSWHYLASRQPVSSPSILPHSARWHLPLFLEVRGLHATPRHGRVTGWRSAAASVPHPVCVASQAQSVLLVGHSLSVHKGYILLRYS